MTDSLVPTHRESRHSLSSSWGWFMGLVSLILPSQSLAQGSPAWLNPCLQELQQQYSLVVPGGSLNQPVTRGELTHLVNQIRISRDPAAENLPRFTERQGTEFYTVDPHRHVSRWQLWESLTEEFGYEAAGPARETLRRYYQDAILVQDETALEAIAAAAERGLVVNPSG
ncbi:hypothetical protein E1H12_12115, partial [Geitlerinema sp. P-1104]|nr:hypothetical protein [Geitlerinema sp. P-1104]